MVLMDSAIVEFSKAIKIYDDYSDAYYNRACCFQNKEEYAKAIEDYEKGATLYSKPNIQLYVNLGFVYGKTGQYDKELSVLDSAIKYNPKLADAYNNKGCVLLEQQKYVEALAELKKAIELIPNNASAHYNQGVCYIKTGDLEAAIEANTRAIACNPNYSKAYFNRSQCYHSLRKVQNALEDALKAKSLGFPVDSNYVNQLKNELTNRTSSIP